MDRIDIHPQSPLQTTDFSRRAFVVTGLAANQVEVRYTLSGDATLDGTVDIADFGKFSANFGKSGQTWDQGDFTYDGSVGFSDLLIQGQNFNGTT